MMSLIFMLLNTVDRKHAPQSHFILPVHHDGHFSIVLFLLTVIFFFFVPIVSETVEVPELSSSKAAGVGKNSVGLGLGVAAIPPEPPPPSLSLALLAL